MQKAYTYGLRVEDHGRSIDFQRRAAKVDAHFKHGYATRSASRKYGDDKEVYSGAEGRSSAGQEPKQQRPSQRRKSARGKEGKLAVSFALEA